MTEELDALVVGAGLSGICAAYHLRQGRPDRSVAILEARESMGGTWDLFRYPGVRSDSDMATLGYGFRPWTSEKAIADGPAILSYIHETARETGIDRLIRYRHRMVAADWNSARARWIVTVDTPGGTRTIAARWLSICTGYYDYAGGHRPDWPGEAEFAGPIIHPQAWPEDLDWTGKRVVVIGSGATAVTLVPELAKRAAHVTMLQRSPTHIMAMPASDAVANALRRLLGDRWGHAVTRWKNILLTMAFYQLAQKAPNKVAGLIRKGAMKAIGPGADEAALTPRYAPWEQRLCLVPDGDFFAALKAGDASIVTDGIDRFDAAGLCLASGGHLPADIVVAATGLKVQVAGGAAISMDGVPVNMHDHFAYKGVMYSGLPNLSVALGYINASWTLKCELIARYTRRLLDHMEAEGWDWAVPEAPPESARALTTFELSSGYLERARDIIPQQTDRAPWRMLQNYVADRRLIAGGPVTDHMRFGRAPGAEAAQNPARVLSTPPRRA
ncbi:flavin-containing monooxygenase [Jannaschia ovalis]|uniref:NAD(P)/FAD-dependent oxidoreductase n=1 Tax=Jannaschia ovalis TaxID=3038773 RepID=A0ABY8LCH3_9RHOB|nr:NAD(P)/FAD-dependent oxidoreductase [Jannaschia sp. GRR-S6-38]WGH78317.1 NAD(P)/FAD-dependent oxidoreductase [Jannaschia sp. GRR-S6-38]